jgi:hypothetical protein
MRSNSSGGRPSFGPGGFGGPGGPVPALPDAPNAAALLVAPYANVPHDSTVWLTDHLRDFVAVPIGTVDSIPGTGVAWLSLTQPPPAANVAALATVAYANVPRGQSVYVLSRFRNYVSVPITNGDAPGTGNDWKSNPNTSAPSQLVVPDWYVDTVAGSDDNPGTLAQPLLSGQEVVDRRGGGLGTLSAPVTVHVVSTVAAPFRIIADVAGIAHAANFTIQGTRTILLSTTVATYTANAGNVAKSMTCTGVADWATAGPAGSSLVGKLFRVIGGARDGTVGCIMARNPAGAGNAVARLSQLGTTDSVVNVNLVAGDAIQVYDASPCDIIDVNFRGRVYDFDPLVFPTFVVNDCNVANLTARGFDNSNLGMHVFGCYLLQSRTFSDASDQTSAPALLCCAIAQLYLGQFLTVCCAFFPFAPNTIMNRAGQNTGDDSGTYQGVRPLFRSPLINIFRTLYAFDTGGSCFSILWGSKVVSSSGGTFRGVAAAGFFGVELYVGATFIYDSAQLPTATGTGGDVQLLGTPALVLPWTGLPWPDGARSGNGAALVAGAAAPVAVPYVFGTQAVTVAHNTPAGVGSPGTLQVRDADRTTTNLGVRSSLATDAGSFNWAVAPVGRQQFIIPR